MKKLFILFVIGVVFAGIGMAADLVITDPIQIGVGARPMGMGRAYIALAEDGDTIFMNPAGLAGISGPKITSMYTSLMGDVNYVVLGGAYPITPNSSLGVGLISNSITGIDLRDGNQISLGNGNWGTTDIIVGYGMLVPEAKLQIGANVKYLTQSGSGTEDIAKAASSGVSCDVGMIYSPTDSLSIAMVAENPLGAQLDSGLNAQNNLAAVYKVGTAFKTRVFDTQKLNLAVDADMGAKQSTTYHAGIEYYPIPTLALRAGLDQDPADGGVETNPTAGIGLRVSGVEFNYAFHPYSISQNETHYFSISYVGAEPQPKEESVIVLTSPTDKSIVYADNVKVAGRVPIGHSEIVTVNGTGMAIDPKTGEFNTALPLDKIGKKLVMVETKAKDGKKVAESRRVLRLVSFKDVGEGYWAKQPIENTGTVGLIQGYPDQTFKPEKSLTRAELATILIRTKGLPNLGKPVKVFKDVQTKHWAASYIEVARRMEIIKGYPNGKFMPNKKVTKAEAIAILARYDKLQTFVVDNEPYKDVSAKFWAAGFIQAAKEAGMLSYVKETRLRPNEDVSRSEAVEMMSHTSLADKLIKDLLSWDKGYQYELSQPLLKAGL